MNHDEARKKAGFQKRERKKKSNKRPRKRTFAKSRCNNLDLICMYVERYRPFLMFVSFIHEWMGGEKIVCWSRLLRTTHIVIMYFPMFKCQSKKKGLKKRLIETALHSKYPSLLCVLDVPMPLDAVSGNNHLHWP